MRLFFIIAGWTLVGAVGLLLYFTFPEVQHFVGWAIGGAFAYHMLSEIIKDTTRRIVTEELMELRRQSNNAADRLDEIDRKVSAILRDALERRRAG